MTTTQLLQASMGQEINGLHKIEGITDHYRNIAVYVSPDHSTLVIGFSCTQGTAYPPSHDWLRNLWIWPKKTALGSKSCYAHAGFVDEYESMRQIIYTKISTFNPKKVYLAGHSQGGAHATLCFRDLSWKFKNLEIDAVVFASPRVYTDRGAIEFDLNLDVVKARQSFERFNVWGDPVPHLPPWFLGYCHVGHCKMIGKFRLFLDPKVHNGESYIQSLSLMEQSDART